MFDEMNNDYAGRDLQIARKEIAKARLLNENLKLNKNIKQFCIQNILTEQTRSTHLHWNPPTKVKTGEGENNKVTIYVKNHENEYNSHPNPQHIYNSTDKKLANHLNMLLNNNPSIYFNSIAIHDLPHAIVIISQPLYYSGPCHFCNQTLTMIATTNSYSSLLRLLTLNNNHPAIPINSQLSNHSGIHFHSKLRRNSITTSKLFTIAITSKSIIIYNKSLAKIIISTPSYHLNKTLCHTNNGALGPPVK
jgi:hypothetical protein